MSRISVRPEELERLSAQLHQVAETLRSEGARLDHSVDVLDWSVRQKEGINRNSDAAREQSAGLADKAEQWSRILSMKAKSFTETDQALARDVTHVTSGGGAGGTAPAPSPGAVSPGGGGAGVTVPGDAGSPVVTAPSGSGTAVTSTNRGWPVDAPVISSLDDRNHMSAEERKARYNDVLSQFGVAKNPRYLPSNGDTYCNIFVTDATRAMGAEIPHWVDKSGAPVRPGTPGANELDANETVAWLEKHGAEYGWHAVSPQQAQANANDGRPAVAVMHKNPIGHVAMVAPGEYTAASGPASTNVGARNFDHGTVAQGFGQGNLPKVVYYVHK
ncbi:MAG TPA: hypothetical protein VNT75_06780 [Symbiobacteriaceae bacterium]|nr:hypothetical protein [Symbiobacteriaceae bacterium]